MNTDLKISDLLRRSWVAGRNVLQFRRPRGVTHLRSRLPRTLADFKFEKNCGSVARARVAQKSLSEAILSAGIQDKIAETGAGFLGRPKKNRVFLGPLARKQRIPNYFQFLKHLNEKGTAAIELVYIAPIFLLFIIIVASFFEGFNAKEKMVMQDRVQRLSILMQQEVPL